MTSEHGAEQRPAEHRDLPLFPLGAVLFPGQSLPLRIFEERYRAMVEDLLDVADPTERLFGSVAIKEGYEVGEHGVQTMYRTGCLVQLVDARPSAGGGYAVDCVVRGRFRLSQVVQEQPYVVARVALVDEPRPVPGDDLLGAKARRRYESLRTELEQWRDEPILGSLPQDPEYLSWTLSARTPLPLPQRQDLLEAHTTGDRLTMLSTLIGDELRAMAAIPSLPASDIARTRWSPN
ncbi:LON peptidase substrate-binding domain-containing protein [Nocardioides yefusunii]|uniref:LON peptidase substrate-binding domain-containing protein n=1 Tax=Nocardioides yefusunii TaxID=2500546 RepID=A0ABW1QW42_9ACTN|nr:LON peptidase substrate-binding domain-containing protein [Nocardioides yefusunii]